MTADDAAGMHAELGNTIGRDIFVVSPGEGPIYTDDSGRDHVALYLLILDDGVVTFTTLSGDSRTFTATAGMSFPIRLDVFVTHVTASTATVMVII